MYLDVPAKLRKFDFPLTNFSPNYPPINIPFLFEKPQFCPNWVLFAMIASKYTQFFFNLGSLFLMETHQSLFQILQKSTVKGRHIYLYHVNVRTPPVSFSHSRSMGVHDRGRVDQRVQNAFQMETKRQKIVKRRSKWKE